MERDDTLYRLLKPVRTIHASSEKSGIVMIPSDEIVRITGHPDGDRFVQVRWEDKELLMFAQDLRERAAPALNTDSRT